MSTNLTIDDIRRRIAGILADADVERCLLFGSRARNDASRRSDIDLLVIKASPGRFLDRTRDLQYQLSAAFPEAPVEVLCYTPEEIEQLSSRRFFQTVLKEGKLVYEHQQCQAKGLKAEGAEHTPREAL